MNGEIAGAGDESTVLSIRGITRIGDEVGFSDNAGVNVGLTLGLKGDLSSASLSANHLSVILLGA
jgi:hypothetical protein